MSTLTGYVKAAAVGALGQLADVLLSTRASLSYIIPQVVLEEEHTDDVTVTDNPIETGAPVSDHSFALPSQLTMVIGWSESLNPFDISATSTTAQDAADVLLDLQAQREPFNVTTLTRKYTDMLITSIRQRVTQETIKAPIFEVSLRKVFLVDTAVATLPPITQQAQPEKTAAPVDSGPKQVTPPKTSALLDITNSLKGALKGVITP